VACAAGAGAAGGEAPATGIARSLGLASSRLLCVRVRVAAARRDVTTCMFGPGRARGRTEIREVNPKERKPVACARKVSSYVKPRVCGGVPGSARVLVTCSDHERVCRLGSVCLSLSFQGGFYDLAPTSRLDPPRLRCLL